MPAYTGTQIVDRALRICGILAEGESANSTQLSDALLALNAIIDEWNADGMLIWKISTITLTGAVTGITTTINTSGTHVTNDPPNKVLEVYYKNTDSGVDTPVSLITKNEYDLLSPKATTGVPTQVYYRPPSAPSSAGTAQPGTFYWYPALSADFIADHSLHVTAMFPLRNAITSSTYPDVPNYMSNALIWNLADQLTAEYGVGLAERSTIAKKAQFHKAVAMSFDQEEGSIYFQPDSQYA
jgi:hypothetical protein